jgi:cyanate lyase
VSKPLFRPPRHLVKEWPEVFEDLYMNTMPVAYLELIHIEFGDGRVWEINVQQELENKDCNDIADQLLETFQEYKEEIKKIDFKLDIEKLKKDISDQTKNYL